MPTKSPTIEDIILQQDVRGVSALRPHLAPDYVTEAAQLVLDNPGKVLIATGFYILSGKAPETDGPPGAAAIGNALKALGYTVAFVTDRFSAHIIRPVVGDEVVEFPVLGHRESAEFGHQLVEKHNPSLLIAIERAGLTGDGTFRNMRGLDISEFNAKIDHLFDQHPVSVGIGDGGNEIGMGNLAKVIPDAHEKLPRSPAVTTTTKLIAASCSNWGGYGLVAALSLLKKRNLLPSVEQEMEWVRTTVKHGAVDGFTGEKKDFVDGRSLEDNAVCLRELHSLLKRRRVK
jgi:hypothetical protein